VIAYQRDIHYISYSSEVYVGLNTASNVGFSFDSVGAISLFLNVTSVKKYDMKI